MVLKLKHGYLKMSDPELQRKANEILFSMKDNVNFPHPIPTIVTMENCLKTYIRLLAESSTGDRICIAQKNEARIPLIHNLHQWGYFVLWMSNGEPVKAMSSGFTLGYIPGPRTALEKPTALRVTKGINDGDLVCKGG